jgi:cobalt-zinc-cadmium efflux system protein
MYITEKKITIMAEPRKTNSSSEHLFEYRYVEQKKLVFSLSITIIAMFVELIGGYLTNSMALYSDAGHMFTHAFALIIGLAAIIIARKPPCHHQTFGLYRAEVLAAFVNGLFLLTVVGLVIYEAILRLLHPIEILGLEMLAVAFIGLVVNILSILILRGAHQKDLNIRGVFYHMFADAISSVGIVIAALVIMYTNWIFVDPIVSIGISIIIVFWAWGVLKDSTRILLETAPKGLNIDMISEDLKRSFSEIQDLHNVHLWSITPDMLVFSAHLQFNSKNIREKQEESISKINDYLLQKYNIIECTIQICTDQGSEVCNISH